jgi:hypothetical protein
MRGKIILGSVLGAVAIHVAFLACGGSSGRGSDGGVLGSLADVIAGETGDAQAQSGTDAGSGTRTMETRCDQTTMINGTTFYRAEFSVPGFDPRTGPDVSARLCDLTCTRSTCVIGQWLGMSNWQCQNQTGIWMNPGHISVYCGVEGDRGQIARITIR